MSGEIIASQKKNPAIIQIERSRGTNTIAETQVPAEPEVKEKINRIRATKWKKQIVIHH